MGHIKLTDFGLSEAGLVNQNLYKNFIEKIDNDSDIKEDIENAQRINSLDRLDCISNSPNKVESAIRLNEED